MSDKDFIAHLKELIGPLGRVTARAMFGAWGLYLDGVIIGLVEEGRLYFKTDAINQPLFAAAGCSPFTYMSKDGPMTMSYWSVPEEALDAADAMEPWARLAMDAARRKAAAKPIKKAKSAQTNKAAGIEKATATKETTKAAKRVRKRKGP
jgi:DNA transformation protein and related proteins